jgi:imidazolonepropionase-like amidohydrolase
MGLFTACLLGVIAAGPAMAQSLAVRADTLITVSGPPIKNGVVIVRNGKITEVGAGLSIPSGMTVLHAAVVMPGLVDPHSYLGCQNETDEPVDAVTPDSRACDAFDPQSPLLRAAIAAGITTTCLMPGNGNVVGGQAAVVRLGLKPQVLKGYAAQKFSISQDAASPQRNPTSRAGVVSIARAALSGARNNVPATSSRQISLLVGEFPTSLSERSAALKPVLSGAVPIFIHAPQPSDAQSALQIADEFHLHPVLLHTERGDRVVDLLKSHGTAVILGPLKFEDKDPVLKNPGELAKAGIKVAFCSDAPNNSPASLRMTARLAVQYGMSPEAAIRALTLNGAQMIGIGARTGSIERGKDADLLLLSGDPLDLTSRVQAVISGGAVVYKSGGQK